MLAHTNDPTSDPQVLILSHRFHLPQIEMEHKRNKEDQSGIEIPILLHGTRLLRLRTAARVARYKALQEQDAQLHNLRMEWEKERIQMERNLLEFKMEQEKKKYGCL
ncbi:uncharacterized protein LOC113472343 [Diaphorina citri]|uniref:Uncharacterized protein LOC113472343 n=1 Tax=Diaphorina citri TaxID=121845 RepID=A0A3Q0JHG5_DIACI|nr:uncharacterized protein LOC113472343 [Diaphorina citri]